MSEQTVAEQIEQAQAEEVPAETQRAAKLAEMDAEAAKHVLAEGSFEDQPLSEADKALLASLTAPSSDQDAEDEVEAAEAKDFDPNLDNPLDPKGEPPEMSEEEIAKQAEQIAKQNRETLKNNRRAAKDWISKKTGRGVLIGQDPDGAVHCLVLGDEEQIANTEIKVDSDLYNLIMALILSHLPGASVNSQVMHAQSMQALNNVANNLMAGLQATNNNVLQLVSFLKMKFPELQAQVQTMGQTESGILVPK